MRVTKHWNILPTKVCETSFRGDIHSLAEQSLQY